AAWGVHAFDLAAHAIGRALVVVDDAGRLIVLVDAEGVAVSDDVRVFDARVRTPNVGHFQTFERAEAIAVGVGAPHQLTVAAAWGRAAARRSAAVPGAIARRRARARRSAAVGGSVGGDAPAIDDGSAVAITDGAAATGGRDDKRKRTHQAIDRSTSTHAILP